MRWNSNYLSDRGRVSPLTRKLLYRHSFGYDDRLLRGSGELSHRCATREPCNDAVLDLLTSCSEGPLSTVTKVSRLWSAELKVSHERRGYQDRRRGEHDVICNSRLHAEGTIPNNIDVNRRRSTAVANRRPSLRFVTLQGTNSRDGNRQNWNSPAGVW